MTRKELAESYFLKGYNCTQAIVLAFKDLIDIDEKTLLKSVSAFGGGMSRLRETCGAFTGILFVLGYLYGRYEPTSEAKTDIYTKGQELAKNFIKENKFLRCRDILGKNFDNSPVASERDKKYYQSRPCKSIIGNAAQILDDYIQSH